MSTFELFLLAHLVGDWLLQTSYQALNKDKGRWYNRAIVNHCLVYTTCFIPTLWWQGLSPTWLAVIFLSHILIDRRWPIVWWCLHIKRIEEGDLGKLFLVTMMVDQVFHFLIIAIIAMAGGRQ